MKVRVECALGEFFDKISILSIKREFIDDGEKLKFIDFELNHLLGILKKLDLEQSYVEKSLAELKKINKRIWDCEEVISRFLDSGQKDSKFLEASWESHVNNKLRFKIKQEINNTFSSAIIEVKSYD